MLIKFQIYILGKYSTRTATVVRAISSSPVQPSTESVAVERAMPVLAGEPSTSRAPVQPSTDSVAVERPIPVLAGEQTTSRAPVQPSTDSVAVERAIPDLAREPSTSTAPVQEESEESDVCESLFLLLILVEEFTLFINIF